MLFIKYKEYLNWVSNMQRRFMKFSALDYLVSFENSARNIENFKKFFVKNEWNKCGKYFSKSLLIDIFLFYFLLIKNF